MAEKPSEPKSTVDPNLPYWIRQEAEFAGALGRATRKGGFLAVAAWVFVGITVIGALLGLIARLLFR